MQSEKSILVLLIPEIPGVEVCLDNRPWEVPGRNEMGVRKCVLFQRPCIPEPKTSNSSRNVCQIKPGNTSVFLKEMRSRGKVSPVCENTERKACLGACSPGLASVRFSSLWKDAKTFVAWRSGPSQRGGPAAGSCLTRLHSLHLLTALSSNIFKCSACRMSCSEDQDCRGGREASGVMLGVEAAASPVPFSHRSSAWCGTWLLGSLGILRI